MRDVDSLGCGKSLSNLLDHECFIRCLGDVGIKRAKEGGTWWTACRYGKAVEQNGLTLKERSFDTKHGFIVVGYLATVLVMGCRKFLCLHLAHQICVMSVRK